MKQKININTAFYPIFFNAAVANLGAANHYTLASLEDRGNLSLLQDSQVSQFLNPGLSGGQRKPQLAPRLPGEPIP